MIEVDLEGRLPPVAAAQNESPTNPKADAQRLSPVYVHDAVARKRPPEYIVTSKQLWDFFRWQ